MSNADNNGAVNPETSALEELLLAAGFEETVFVMGYKEAATSTPKAASKSKATKKSKAASKPETEEKTEFEPVVLRTEFHKQIGNSKVTVTVRDFSPAAAMTFFAWNNSTFQHMQKLYQEDKFFRPLPTRVTSDCGIEFIIE